MGERAHPLDREALLWVLGVSASDRLSDASYLQSEPSSDWRANLEAILLITRDRLSHGISDPFSIFPVARPAFEFATEVAPAEAIIASLMLPERELIDQLDELLDVVSDEKNPSFEHVARLGAVFEAVTVREGTSRLRLVRDA